MSLPFFYIEELDSTQTTIVLDEDTSKHVVSVLRMKVGEQLHLTDGKGNLIVAEIADDHKKKCVVTVIAVKFEHPPERKISIAISLLKNANRFEWFLEKATELGISEIIPIICERTEKTHFRYDRMKNILVSALLQSQQSWLPQLQQPVAFNQFIAAATTSKKFIAHCIPEQKTNLIALVDQTITTQLICIGPEGDFTPTEIAFALQHNFLPVSLGETRLRTETAGMVAATILKLA